MNIGNIDSEYGARRAGAAGTIAATASAASVAVHVADPADAHDASAVSFTPAGGLVSTDTQAAIEEAATMGGGGTPSWISLHRWGL